MAAMGATAMTPADASVIYDIRYLNEDLGREVEEVLHTLRPKLKNVHLEISGGREKAALRPIRNPCEGL